MKRVCTHLSIILFLAVMGAILHSCGLSGQHADLSGRDASFFNGTPAQIYGYDLPIFVSSDIFEIPLPDAPPLRFLRFELPASAKFAGIEFRPPEEVWIMSDEMTNAQAASILSIARPSMNSQACGDVIRSGYKATSPPPFDTNLMIYADRCYAPFVIENRAVADTIIMAIANHFGMAIRYPTLSEWIGVYRLGIHQTYPWGNSWADRPAGLVIGNDADPYILLQSNAYATHAGSMVALVDSLHEAVHMNEHERQMLREYLLKEWASNRGQTPRGTTIIHDVGLLSIGGGVGRREQLIADQFIDPVWFSINQWGVFPDIPTGLRLVLVNPLHNDEFK